MQRQPFGGWKKSAVGAGTKAGGPNYLVGLGSWVSKPSTAAGTPAAAPAHSGVRRIEAAAKGFLSADELGSLQRALHSDARAWAAEFGTAKDVSGLSAERNVFRYLPLNPLVRLAEGESLANLCGPSRQESWPGPPRRSPPPSPFPPGAAVLSGLRIKVTVESDAEWLAAAGRSPRGFRPHPPDRRRRRPCPRQPADARTWPSTPTRSPRPAAWRCCRSCTSRPSASRRTASAPRTTSRMA